MLLLDGLVIAAALLTLASDDRGSLFLFLASKLDCVHFSGTFIRAIFLTLANKEKFR